MRPIHFGIRLIDPSLSYTQPRYAHIDDVGLDLFFKGPTETIRPATVGKLGTNVTLELFSDMMGLVLSRSGLASRGIFVANAPGLIDPGYKGEIMVLLYNGSSQAITVQPEDKIAQLVVLRPVDKLLPVTFTHSLRGSAGFGSTG